MWHPRFRPLRWIFRFRHRRGYNIHSPFAFSLVTGVVYEAEAYYAYAPLSEQGQCGRLREKDYRLLLRLMNHIGAGRAVLWNGTDAVAEAYLRAGRSSCHITLADRGEPLPNNGAHLLYIDRGERLAALGDEVLRLLTPQSVIIVGGIHRNAMARRAWHHLQSDDRVRITFDLYDFGLAYTECRLNKEDYLINYF